MKKVLSIIAITVVAAASIIMINTKNIETTNTGMLIEFKNGTGYYIGK